MITRLDHETRDAVSGNHDLDSHGPATMFLVWLLPESMHPAAKLVLVCGRG